MAKKKMFLMLLSVGLIISNTACGNIQADELSDENAVKDLSGEVEILWQIDGAESLWDPVLEYFEENYPDLTITFNKDPNAYESIRNRFISGDVPDIFYTWHTSFDFASAYRSGMLSPIDDILDSPTFENDGTLRERLSDTIIETGEYEGNHYFIPLHQMMYVPLYSETYFKENDYSVPETWEEFLTLCEDIKNAGEASPMVYPGAYPEYLGNSLILTEIYNQDPETLERIYNGESAWSEPAGIKAAEKLETMVREGYIDTNSLAYDHIQSQMEFLNYHAAMFPGGTWVENEMSGQWPDDFELSPFIIPSETGNLTALLQQSEIVVPYKDDQNREAITEIFRVLFSYAMQEKAIEISGLLPAFEEIGDEYLDMASPSTKKTYELIEEKNVSVVAPMIEIKFGKIMPDYYNNVNALVEGSIDSKTFCANMDEAMKTLE